MSARQRHPDAVKHRAVQLGNHLGNDAEAERTLGLPLGSICGWRKRGFGSGPQAPPATPAHLEAMTASGSERGPVDELLARLGTPATVVDPIPLVAASGIAPTRWELIWRDRLPATALTVIAGRPGLGKSTLEAAIAAELSLEGLTGVISNLEDDPQAVTIPRLLAAGGDLSRIMLIPRESAPSLPDDFDRLEQLIASSGARFLILDPIAAHFSPEARVHSRSVLGRLMALANRHHCAIVGIHHSTKSHSIHASAIEAIGGPQGGLSGACRAAYLYGKDPSDEDRRALACVKINGVDRPATLIIEHETVEVPAAGMLLEAGVLSFVEETNTAAEEVMGRGQTRRERDAECQEWLTEYLADGDSATRTANEVRVASRTIGFSWQTVLRSAVEVGVVKSKVGFGADQLWYWRLADDHPLRRLPAGIIEDEEDRG